MTSPADPIPDNSIPSTEIPGQDREALPRRAEPTEGTKSVRAQLLDRGWRQGSVLPAEPTLREALVLDPFARNNCLPDGSFWLIISSQDCNVIAESFEVEPTVEVVLALPIERARSDYQYGRHPRELHVQLETREGAQAISLHVRDRGQIERRHLLTCSPDSAVALSGSGVRQIAGLFAGRYDRAAFPDAFETRFDRAKRSIRRALENNFDKIQDVLLVVDPLSELSQDEPYKLYVYILVTDSLADGPTEDFNRFQTGIAGEIRRVIRRCNGIELEKLSVCRSDDISLREFSKMRAIDFESVRSAVEDQA
jgi:hypothetical protein